MTSKNKSKTSKEDNKPSAKSEPLVSVKALKTFRTISQGQHVLVLAGKEYELDAQAAKAALEDQVAISAIDGELDEDDLGSEE